MVLPGLNFETISVQQVQYLYLYDREMSVNEILDMWKYVDTKRLLDLKLKCVFDYTDKDMANEPRPKAAAASSDAGETVSRASTDKNDKMCNELEMLKRENAALKIEVAYLRVS